ncbi:quinone oxidoreductase family protein [Actinomadura rayongensis]|uniref:Alcohol dehydrogenase catalytic domain-containing protein n=1 Tax=Actinomadura rayongensis TaxID=1429076 RepID=A0A6I4WCW2_9ACTN|nr:alcohol dehydrogenase catalytic domain-containing protein [Actinomadura rayongensis]MXQ67548.1 alcohol dehydrogenase catalytic domain-containing protein [Actinomadura rayongensis]
MKAVILPEFGPPDVLELQEVPLPEPGRGEVRVRVGAAFVAFGRDVGTRSGRHPVFRRLVTLPHILGGEHAGVVDAVGDGAEAALLGRRVAVSAPVVCGACEPCRSGRPWDCSQVIAVGIQRPGAYAEYTVVPAANVHEIPDELSFSDAAAYAASGPLAWEQLDVAGAGNGDWVFVPGASGSVGLFLVALAKRRGADVVAATRGGRAVEQLTALGADAVVDAGDDDLGRVLRDLSPSGMQVVVDNVMDQGLWDRYWPAVARRGRIVTAGQASGHGRPLSVDIIAFYNRRATLSGLAIGDPRAVRSFWDEMRGGLLPMDATMIAQFPLSKAADAHRHIESGSKIGHVVLTVEQ